MGYIFNFSSSNDGIEWSAPLIEKKCAYSRCNNIVSIGLPYCEEHSERFYGVKVSEGKYGRGVIAVRDLTKNISLPYHGEVISKDELKQRYGHATGPYSLQSKKGKFEDAALSRGIAACVNHAEDDKVNCILTWDKEGQRNIIFTVKAIKQGEELFCSYYGYNPDKPDDEQVKVKKGDEYQFNEAGVSFDTVLVETVSSPERDHPMFTNRVDIHATAPLNMPVKRVDIQTESQSNVPIRSPEDVFASIEQGSYPYPLDRHHSDPSVLAELTLSEDQNSMNIFEISNVRENKNKLVFPEGVRGSSMLGSITWGDIDRLRGLNWINSELINSALIDVFPVKNQNYYAFNTFFLEQITKKYTSWDSDTLKRLTRNVDFTKEYLIIPCHMVDHWSVVIVYGNNIVYHDSFTLSIIQNWERYTNWVKRMLEEAPTAPKRNWITVNAQQAPRQENASDCGVFSLFTPLAVINKMDYRRVNQEQVSGFRRVLALMLTRKTEIKQKQITTVSYRNGSSSISKDSGAISGTMSESTKRKKPVSSESGREKILLDLVSQGNVAAINTMKQLKARKLKQRPTAKKLSVPSSKAPVSNKPRVKAVPPPETPERKPRKQTPPAPRAKRSARVPHDHGDHWTHLNNFEKYELRYLELKHHNFKVSGAKATETLRHMLWKHFNGRKFYSTHTKRFRKRGR